MVYNLLVANGVPYKTDPEIRYRKRRQLEEEEYRPARRRSVFVPLGMLAVLVLGIHAAASSFAEWAFAFIDWFASLIEAAFGRFADAALSDAETRKRALAEAFDIESRRNLARWMALIVEVLLVVRLAAACIGASVEPARELDASREGPFRRRFTAWLARPIIKLKEMFAKSGGYLSSISVEKIYLPLSVTVAVIAGALALFVALDNAFFSLSRHLPGGAGANRWLSPWPAAISSLLVLFRLGLPAVTGSLARCHLAAERDRAAGEPVSKRMTRGIWGAVLVLPIILVGAWMGTPLAAWFGRLVGMGS